MRRLPRRGVVKGIVAASLAGLALLVAGLCGAAVPVLIWTHAAGTEVHVRGTAQVRTPRSGLVCKGWVLPPGVAPRFRTPAID
jgi:hypothetical protein